MSDADTAEPSYVVVTPGVGTNVVRITARLRDGRRPVELVVDRDVVREVDVARLIRVVERFLRRHDPEHRHLRLLP